MARLGTEVTQETLEKFYAKVEKGRPSECWYWTGAISSNGYGMFCFSGWSVGAHRVAFLIANGHWPNVARHDCDNPPCVNPAHIRDGSQADNNRDMYVRGRNRNGEYQKARTHCPQGHEYTPENTAVVVRKDIGASHRRCRQCQRDNAERYRQRKMATQLERQVEALATILHDAFHAEEGTSEENFRRAALEGLKYLEKQ